MGDFRPASLDSVEKYATRLETRSLLCRSKGHVWAALSSRVTNVGDRIYLSEDCEQCETSRTIIYTRDGYIAGRRYDYPDGYQSDGIGRIDTHGRALLRVEMFRRLKGD